uniref:Uncharacterized protein n=1 Tax=Ditylenchus dipsaci TaxID=166011 RepID=A0A915E023_9BILA
MPHECICLIQQLAFVLTRCDANVIDDAAIHDHFNDEHPAEYDEIWEEIDEPNESNPVYNFLVEFRETAIGLDLIEKLYILLFVVSYGLYCS